MNTRYPFIPRAEIEAFLASVPADVHLFPEHADRGVRRISLRDVYRRALDGLTFLHEVLNACPNADLRDFLAIYVNLETSLNPFLARNPHLLETIALLADRVAADVEENLLSGYLDLSPLVDLRLARRLLPRPLGKRVRRALEAATRYLEEEDRGLLLAGNPFFKEAIEAGGSPADEPNDGTSAIWELWMYQVLEHRYVDLLGIDVDLDAFYERTVAELIAIPFAEEYAIDLYNVLTHTSYGLTLFHRIPMRGIPVMVELARHGMELFSWLEQESLYNHDPEVIGEFLDAFLKGPSLGYGSDPRFGVIMGRLLESQNDDGSWGRASGDEPLERMDAEDLYDAYHPTWVCVDALRPMRHDLLDPDNRRVGLM